MKIVKLPLDDLNTCFHTKCIYCRVPIKRPDLHGHIRLIRKPSLKSHSDYSSSYQCFMTTLNNLQKVSISDICHKTTEICQQSENSGESIQAIVGNIANQWDYRTFASMWWSSSICRSIQFTGLVKNRLSHLVILFVSQLSFQKIYYIEKCNAMENYTYCDKRLLDGTQQLSHWEDGEARGGCETNRQKPGRKIFVQNCISSY